MSARASIAGLGVPSTAPDWLTPALLAETIRVWQPYYAAPLTEADARAIVEAVTGLLDVIEDVGALEEAA